jgi:hypothetical protein
MYSTVSAKSFLPTFRYYIVLNQSQFNPDPHQSDKQDPDTDLRNTVRNS